MLLISLTTRIMHSRTCDHIGVGGKMSVEEMVYKKGLMDHEISEAAVGIHRKSVVITAVKYGCSCEHPTDQECN